MMTCKHHGSVTVGPTGTHRMEKGPTGTRRLEKGSSKDFYDELQASRLSTIGPTGTHRMEKVQFGDL
jgi:tartrate dehydratase beta subunit/fumarate hydratase class I family protein